MEVIEAIGAGSYALIGLAPLCFGVPLLTNALPLGKTGDVFSSGNVALISANGRRGGNGRVSPGDVHLPAGDDYRRDPGGVASCTLVYWFGNWFPRGSMVLGLGFVVDPLAGALALLAAVSFLAFIFSCRFVDAGAGRFHPLMLVFLAAMSGFVLTADLFNLFVWFELMSTAAFALCGLKTNEPAPLQGSFNFAVTNTAAAFLGLTGIALLYAVTGALNMAQIGLQLTNSPGDPRHDQLVLFASTLLVCGFFIKAAIVPFHLWLPDAHAVEPTSVCVLFSGLMVELGLYAVARLHTVTLLRH